MQELDTEKLTATGGTVTGNISLGANVDIIYEGSTANEYETTITVTDPTADRTITFGDETGTVLTTGATSAVTSAMIADGAIVNADINASAEIAVSKLANGTARQLLQTDSGGTGVSSPAMLIFLERLMLLVRPRLTEQEHLQDCFLQTQN